MIESMFSKQPWLLHCTLDEVYGVIYQAVCAISKFNYGVILPGIS